MTDSIMEIFQRDKELLAKVSRAVLYFRECDYEKALAIMEDTLEEICTVTELVLTNMQYFNHVSVESVTEMLDGIAEAKKNRDYILFADLLELQVGRFLCNIQTLIVEQEDFCAFDEENYQRNLLVMERKLSRSTALFVRDAQERELRIAQVTRLLTADLYPEQLLDQGYRVEFTSCGEMTVGVPDLWGNTIYLHTNHYVAQESFLLARSWILPEAKKYVVYGFGMGYVIRELLALLPQDAVVAVYENDINLLKLACAFTDADSLLADKRLRVIYDSDCRFIRGALKNKDSGTKVCVHYPSLCHLTQKESREILLGYLPWAHIEQF